MGTYNVCVIIFAMVVFSSFVSSITNGMSQIRLIQKQVLRHNATLRRFFAEHKVPLGLKTRIWRFLRQSSAARRLQAEEEEVLMRLPIHLRAEMEVIRSRKILTQHPLLAWLNIVEPTMIRNLSLEATQLKT